MDAHKRTYGLKAITIGDVAGDGGMGTSLTEILGDTVPGTAVLESTAPTVEQIRSEESAFAIESITTEEGSFTIRFNTLNTSEEALNLLFGGTVSGTGATKKWESADTFPIVEKSVRVETKNGSVYSMPRVQLSGKMTLTFQSSGLGIIEVTGQVLKPTKADTPALTKGVAA